MYKCNYLQRKSILPYCIYSDMYYLFQMEDKLKNLETDMKILSTATPLTIHGDIFSSDVNIIQTDDNLSDNAGM